MRYTIMSHTILLMALGQSQTRAHAEASYTIDLEAPPP